MRPSRRCDNGTPARLLVGGDPFFTTRREQIVALATRHGIPAMYPNREYAVAGGLMSYGTASPTLIAARASTSARILKGAKPADLPVEQPIKFELVINLRPPRRSASTCRRRCSPAPTR